MAVIRLFCHNSSWKKTSFRQNILDSDYPLPEVDGDVSVPFPNGMIVRFLVSIDLFFWLALFFSFISPDSIDSVADILLKFHFHLKEVARSFR